VKPRFGGFLSWEKVTSSVFHIGRSSPLRQHFEQRGSDEHHSADIGDTTNQKVGGGGSMQTKVPKDKARDVTESAPVPNLDQEKENQCW
jgi:hypothetical protein